MSKSVRMCTLVADMARILRGREDSPAMKQSSYRTEVGNMGSHKKLSTVKWENELMTSSLSFHSSSSCGPPKCTQSHQRECQGTSRGGNDRNRNHSWQTLSLSLVSQEVMEMVKGCVTGPWALAETKVEETGFFL